MAHHRLSHRDVARSWIKRFRALDQKMPFSWPGIEIDLLRKEEQELIG